MGLFIVIATTDVRAMVAGARRSYYAPIANLAVVAYDGDAHQLARLLGLDDGGGPGAFIGGFASARPVWRRIFAEWRIRFLDRLATARGLKRPGMGRRTPCRTSPANRENGEIGAVLRR